MSCYISYDSFFTMPRVAVLGAGVTGSFFSKTLLDAVQQTRPGLKVAVDVFEGGRGSGGRCSTRKSREAVLGPSGFNMAITHGTPAFDAKSNGFKAAAESFVAQGLLDRWDDCRMGLIGRTPKETVHVPLNTHTLYRGATDRNGMEGLCDALLEGATLERKTLVSQIKKLHRSAAGADMAEMWELFERDGTSLGEYDWVVVTGTTAASDRWRKAFKSEPPLQQLLATLDEEAADSSAGGMPSLPSAEAAATIRALQAVQSRPVLTMLTVLTGPAARLWQTDFPFDLAHVQGSDVIKKVVRQAGNNPDCLPIIVHSTHEYAEAVTAAGDIRGKHSSIAAILGDPAAEAAAKTEQILSEMQDELTAFVYPWISKQDSTFDAGNSNVVYGPLIHRWGAAFPEQQPQGTLFREETFKVIPGVGLAFCGDYGGEWVGRVETAATSAIAAAEHVAKHL